MRATLFAAALTSVSALPVAAGDVADFPFQPGERLEYDLKWGVLSVGQAVLEVHPMTEFEGEPCWYFTLDVRTNSVADPFYKVRSKFESFVAADFGGTVHYRKKQREGSSHRDIEVFFDRANGTARYFNRGEPKDPVAIPPDSFDPLASVYYFRTLALKEGETYVLHTTDGEKVIDIPLGLDATENVKVKAGRYRSFRLSPDTSDLEGVFENSDKDELRIWVSDDPRHLPVMVAGKVRIGHFWAKLTEIR